MVDPKEINIKLPNYIIEKELGRGAFGVVYLAKKKNDFINKNVALKVFKVNPGNLEHYKKVRREAKLWAEIENHPNIVPIYDANIYEDYFVLESEYVCDGSLEDYLLRQANCQLSVNLATEIAIKILAGLDHLHQSDVIHRDLKPANILLQELNPKLVDFGLARIINDTNSSYTIGGTPLYMSPEAFEGVRSPQVDIWSVGIILYEILVGNVPFPEDVKNNCYKLQNFLSMKDCEISSPLIPDPLKKIIKRSLERDCGKRYSFAKEMKEALEIYQKEILAYNISQVFKKMIEEENLLSVSFSISYGAFETNYHNVQMTVSNSASSTKKIYVSRNFYYNEDDLHLALSEINSRIKDPESFGRRGDFYRYIGDLEKAIESFNKAIEIDHNCTEAYNGLGNLYYYDKHEPEIAIDYYTEAIERNPNICLYYNNRGNAYREKKEFDKSISDFTKAIQLYKDYFLAYNNRGLTYKDKGEIEKAIEDYDMAIKLNPNYSTAYFNRGNIYKNNNDYENAIKDYNKVLELKPDHFIAYTQRGLAYQYKDELDKAILDYTKAIEIDSNYTRAYNCRGFTYYRLKEKEAALADYRKVLEIDDRNTDAYYFRGYLYAQYGEKDKAISDFTKALEINPNDKAAQEQLYELEKGYI